MIRTFDHDDAVARVRALGQMLEARAVAAAYLASLNRSPMWPTDALKSLAYAMALPDHPFLDSFGKQQCIVCHTYGETKVELELAPAAKKRGWGPTTGSELISALLALEAYVGRPKTEPTDADIASFDTLLELFATVPPTTPPSALHRLWQGPRTNKHSRDAILETLGACGLLETRDHVGFFTRWTGTWDREERPSVRADLEQPVVFWRGADRVNRAALDFFFPQSGIGRERFSPRARAPRLIEAEEAILPRRRDVSGSERRVLAPGDVLDFEHEGVHLAALVRGRFNDGKTLLPVIEFCAGTTAGVADLSVCRPRLMGPYREAPHWRRQAIACDGLNNFGTLWSDHKMTVVARAAKMPKGEAYPEADLRVARDLLFMLNGAAALLPGENLD